MYLFADFRVTGKIFWGPVHQVKQKRQPMKVQFWIWGPLKVYYKITCVQIFFKSLRPSVCIVYTVRMSMAV